MSYRSTILIEIGRKFIRSGFAGESSPRFQDDSGLLFEIMSSQSSDLYIRSTVIEIFHHIFIERLFIKPRDCRILILENIVSTRKFRSYLFDILLNEFKFQGICFQPDLFMPILSTGAQSGLIVDIGEIESRCIVIYQNRPLYSSIKFVPIGMHHVRKRFLKLLESCNQSISMDNDILIRNFDEYMSRTINFSDLEDDGKSTQQEDNFQESCICIDSVKIPTSFYSNSILELILGLQNDGFDVTGIEEEGVVGMLIKTLVKCPIDVRNIVSSHIVFSGGGACVPGLSNHIIYLLNSRIRSSDSLKSDKGPTELKISPPFRPSLLTWIGGSIFGSLKSNEEKFIVNNINKNPDSLSSNLSDDDLISQAIPDWMALDPDKRKFCGPI